MEKTPENLIVITKNLATEAKHPAAGKLQRGVNLAFAAGNYADCFTFLRVNIKTQIIIIAVLTIKGIQGLPTKPATI